MTDEQLTELPSLIERGVALFDELYEGREWLHNIDLNTLDMQYLHKDIVCQAMGLEEPDFNDYHTALDMIHLDREMKILCGFDTPKDAYETSDYFILTEMWKAKINDLKQKEGVSLNPPDFIGDSN
jgi:hypothetical protein